MTELEKKLAAALKEALEWNWLDEDVPPPQAVVQFIQRTLAEFERQAELEKNRIPY